MNKVLLLQEIAYAHDIEITYENLHYTKHPLLEGYAWPAKGMIILDESLRGKATQEKCVLTEEVGHCLYPPVANHIAYHYAGYRQLDCWERDNLAVLVAKDERMALRWGTSFLIPDKVFWEYAQKGPHEWLDWLEYFDVTDWFMRAKFGIMRTKHPFKWRELVKRNATG